MCIVSDLLTCAAGTCTIGTEQSPINIPLAEHLAQKSPEEMGNIKFHFEQKLDNGRDIKFSYEQELNMSGDVDFGYEQNLGKYGGIKFQYAQKQKLDRFGDIKFQYNKQTDAVVANPGHGTMQVHHMFASCACMHSMRMNLLCPCIWAVNGLSSWACAIRKYDTTYIMSTACRIHCSTAASPQQSVSHLNLYAKHVHQWL